MAGGIDPPRTGEILTERVIYASSRMAEHPNLRLVTPPVPREQGPRRVQPARRRQGSGRVVAVGGGKGGVGKTLVAANVAIELARRGNRVVVVDCDLGGANLHTSLGMDPPRRSLSEFVRHEVERLEEVAVSGGIANLSLVSGALDDLEASHPNHAQKLRFIRHVHSLDADYVVLDLAAGTGKNTLDFFLMADHKILVLVPEPGAVENAHRFVKAAFWRRLRSASAIFGVASVLDEILDAGRFRGPAEILDAVQGADPETGRQLREQMEAYRPRLVVNQARTDRDADLGPGIVMAWRRHFGIAIDLLGTVEHDDEVWRAARERRPLLPSRSPGLAARSLARIAGRLVELDAAQGIGR
jgi:flagellar biosynthesis protein FlhG